jgi:uncharacterized protein YkwD
MLGRIAKRIPFGRRIRVVVAALALTATAVACTPPAPGGGCTGPGGPPDALSQRVFNLVNQTRAGAGRAPVAWDPQLWCLASEWAHHMGSIGQLAHRDLNAVLYSPAYAGYQTLGENILRGPASLNGDQIHQAWMSSSGHAANILSPAFSRFAFASYYTGEVWAVENFGG